MLDINKTIEYLEEMINRFKKGDKSITVHDNKTNIVTLQHFMRVKESQKL